MVAIRTLAPLDLDSLTQFLTTVGIHSETLATELARPDVYVWKGLFDFDGVLKGVHRGMSFGGSLLLKGLRIAPDLRGSTAALNLALSVIEHARSSGRDGVVVWIEPSKPERFLAARLRIASQGPLIHRYLVPVPSAEHEGDAMSEQVISRPLCGTITFDISDQPMVPSLLPCDVRSVDWVLDRRRLVLSGNPCGSTSDLPLLINALMPLAKELRAIGIELPLPADDVLAAMTILTPGRKRLSRSPVYLGVRSFAAAREIHGALDVATRRVR